MNTQQQPAQASMHGCCVDVACSAGTCMQLPAGKTCGGCIYFRHCAAFYAHASADTYCDFFPRRFVERAAIDPKGGAA